MTAKSARDQALAELAEARERVAKWQAEQAAAQAELDDLQSRVGAEVLADESAAGPLAASMAELRSRIEIAGGAVTAAQRLVTDAESAFLSAELAEYRKPVQAARQALARHQERTRELLDLLEEHEGRYVPEIKLILATHDVEKQGALTLPNLKSAALERAVEEAERPVYVLTEMLAGRDPRPDPSWGANGWEFFPASVWGTEAVVPAPAWTARVAAKRAEVERLEAQEQKLSARAAQPSARQAGPGGEDLAMSAALVRADAEATTAQLEQARRQLAELTGAGERG